MGQGAWQGDVARTAVVGEGKITILCEKMECSAVKIFKLLEAKRKDMQQIMVTFLGFVIYGSCGHCDYWL
jgi:hypothetical protein